MEVNKSKYFIAIIPPEPVKTELFSLKKQFSLEFNTKGALRSPAHITLYMPFEFKEKKEELILNFLTQFCKQQKPFEIGINNLGHFEPKVIFADIKNSPQLVSLHTNLQTEIKPALQLFNSTYQNKGFHPHITLAFRDLKKTNFYLAWEKYKNLEIEKEFTCNSITLLKHNHNSWEEYKEFSFGAH